MSFSADAAAWSQAREAARQASAAWVGVWIAGIIGIAGVTVNAAIAYLAVTGPMRERHTRDLETRISRIRLDRRLVLACRDGLTTVEHISEYLEQTSELGYADGARLFRFKRMLNRRLDVIQHFLGLGVRNKKLVGWSVEMRAFMSDTADSIDIAIANTEDDDIPLGKLEGLLDLMSRRAKRRAELIDGFAAHVRETKKRERSFQRDLDAVWSIRFLLPTERRKLLMTPRD